MAASAQAKDAGPLSSQAVDRFREGVIAYAEGRFADAVDLFVQADSLAPDSAFAFDAARAYEKIGARSSALRWYREYRRRAPGAPDQVLVAASIARLELTLAQKGLQQVTVLSAPPGATVVLDDRPVGVTPWSADLAPGSHQVDLRLAGYVEARSRFELRLDHALDVRASLHEASAGRATAVVGWTGVGVGVAGLGAALGCEIAAARAETDAGNATSASAAAADSAHAADLRLAARVVGIAGAAVTLAGNVLLVIDLTGTTDDVQVEPERAHVAAQVVCGGGSCALGLSGRF